MFFAVLIRLLLVYSRFCTIVAIHKVVIHAVMLFILYSMLLTATNVEKSPVKQQIAKRKKTKNMHNSIAF